MAEEYEQEVPQGQFVCTYPGCTESFPTERKLISHWGSKHREWKYQGGQRVKEGVVLEEVKKRINEAGYVTDDNQEPIDIYNNLRKILMNNGVRDKREAIVELFEYEEPSDWRALERILTQADVVKSKRNMIVDLWKKYWETSTGEVMEDEEEGGYMQMSGGKKKGRSPMNINPAEMANWEIGDYMKYAQDAQKYAMNAKIQMQILDRVLGSMDMGGMGGATGGGNIPADVRAKLQRLEQLEEEQRFQKQMEPLVKELRYLRAEKEDSKDKDEFGSIEKYLMKIKMMEQMGSKEAAEMMRMRMEEKLEQMRLTQQKEVEEMRLRAEQARESSRQLEIKNIQTEMGSKLDMMKQAYELAAQSKKEDLVQTMEKAKAISETFKSISGDAKTADDKKMEAIGGIIDSAIKTMQPVAMEFAKNYGAPKAQAPRPPMTGPRPPMQAQQPSGVVPPVAPGQTAIAKCTTPGCGIDMRIDPGSSEVTCPNCNTRYQLRQQTPPPESLPPEVLDQKRSQLLELDYGELADAARQLGMTPESFNTKEELVEGLLKSRFGVA